jgi:hypothetical protein
MPGIKWRAEAFGCGGEVCPDAGVGFQGSGIGDFKPEYAAGYQ